MRKLLRNEKRHTNLQNGTWFISLIQLLHSWILHCVASLLKHNLCSNKYWTAQRWQFTLAQIHNYKTTVYTRPKIFIKLFKHPLLWDIIWVHSVIWRPCCHTINKECVKYAHNWIERIIQSAALLIITALAPFHQFSAWKVHSRTEFSAEIKIHRTQ